MPVFTNNERKALRTIVGARQERPGFDLADVGDPPTVKSWVSEADAALLAEQQGLAAAAQARNTEINQQRAVLATLLAKL